MVQALASLQLLDATGEAGSADFPITYVGGTTTLSQLQTWIQGLGAAVDTVTDGQITKIRLSILIPLPGGIKSAPVANGDLEETGLFTFACNGTPNAYSVDVPAFTQADFTGNQIASNTDTNALVTYLTTAVNGIVGTDRYGNALVSVKRKVKTFRKHRRALRRA
jgi:hypothetical protein